MGTSRSETKEGVLRLDSVSAKKQDILRLHCCMIAVIMIISSPLLILLREDFLDGVEEDEN